MENLEIEKYIKFERGSLPLIISVPHGGTLEIKGIPNRSQGVLGIDKATIELAQELNSLLKNISPKYFSTPQTPSTIISKIRRKQIDLNREQSEAYSPDSNLAEKFYLFYHDKIKELILENINKFDNSILLDLHGFEKDKRPQGYRDVEIILGTNNLASFFSEPVSVKNRANNLRGNIIKKFIDLDIPIAPGHPRRKEYVLMGGYITRKYGASELEKSQVMQIEISDRIRIYDKELRNRVLESLADILLSHISKSMQIY
jgi:N-formylglutamate amidohydrolase